MQRSLPELIKSLIVFSLSVKDLSKMLSIDSIVVYCRKNGLSKIESPFY